jgi:hypothetical protein
LARDKIRKAVLEKFQSIQEGNTEAVWVSGTQVTELLRRYNPSSVRVALLLLVEEGEIIRERRKGRGKRGATGQSAWYALARIPVEEKASKRK